MPCEFDYFRDQYDQSVQKMFAAVSDLYAKYWSDFFHFAIYEHDEQTWSDALASTHAQYLKDLNVQQAGKILVLACGRGGFSDIIAHNTTGDVLGIDLSKAQLSRAKKHKRDNLRFEQHDIMKVHELQETFDAVCFLDAACYLPDKKLALSRIRQVMNPGARLLLVEWCKQAGLNSIQEELVLHPFMRSWAVPSLLTQSEYQKSLRKHNFKLLEMCDLNDRTRRNWDQGYDNGLKAISEMSIKDLPQLVWSGIKAGPDSIGLIKDQFTAAVYIKVGFDAGFLRYTSFLAEASD